MISSPIWIQYTNVVVTDGRTDTGRQQRPRLRIASCGNKRNKYFKTNEWCCDFV